MGLLHGKPGESLFDRPLMSVFRHNPLPELFQKVQGLRDDRLLVIVTALVVEDRLDATLAAFLPRYRRLTDANDFNFSTKIALLEALMLIPPGILSAATIIRKIRNEFAHHLEVTALDEIKSQLSTDLRNLRAATYSIFGTEDRKPLASATKEFEALAFYCIVGLDAYRENLAYLRTHVDSPDFAAGLCDKAMREDRKRVDAILATKPSRVEFRDGHRYEYYEEGVVNIVPDKGGSPQAPAEDAKHG